MNAQEHITTLIKDNVLNGDNPYVKCFIISNLTCDIKTQNMLYQICDSLMKELGYRFKIEFQADSCILKAHKIHRETPLQRLRARNNYARAHLSLAEKPAPAPRVSHVEHARARGWSCPTPLKS